MNKKRRVVAIIAVILFAIAIGDVLLYVYFFKGNITSKVPEGIREKCNVKEEKFQERNVFVLTPKGKKKTKKAVFYLHGGSYIAELTPTYWNFLSDFTQDTGATIIVPDYPLAPQYNYTDVFEMIMPLYKETVKKIKSENLIIMGDSAGGGMSLALTQKITQEDLTKPSKTILISPWLDVTLENPETKKAQEKDKMLNIELLRLAGISYAGEEKETKNYLVSPIYGPVEKVENLVIYTGTYDILNPDVHKLQEMAREKRSRNYSKRNRGSST